MEWTNNEIRDGEGSLLARVVDTAGARRTRWAWFVRKASSRDGWDAGGATEHRADAQAEAEIALSELR
jgi:hypothetical protein